jgi:hypothetical protein
MKKALIGLAVVALGSLADGDPIGTKLSPD